MAILKGGNEPGDFDSCTLTYNTTSGRFDSTYVRSCLLGAGAATGVTVNLSAITDVWLKCRVWQLANAGGIGAAGTAASAGTLIGISSAGGMLLRVGLRDYTAVQRGISFQRNVAGTWTFLGSEWTADYPFGANSLTDLCVRIKIHASTGSLELYRNSLLIASYTGDTTFSGAIASVTGVSFNSIDSTNYSQAFSEIIVADEDARSFRLKRLTVDAAGANAAWTGAYTDVDDTSVNDSDTISSGTVGQEVSYGTDSALSGSGVWKALLIVARASKGSSGPGTLDMGIRQSSTNSYPVSAALTTSLAPTTAVLTTNPTTSASFTNSDLNALEIALRSAT